MKFEYIYVLKWYTVSLMSKQGILILKRHHYGLKCIVKYLKDKSIVDVKLFHVHLFWCYFLERWSTYSMMIY
jgi:hypothetical protein